MRCLFYFFIIDCSGFVSVVAIRGNGKVSVDVCVLLSSVSLVLLPFCSYIMDVFVCLFFFLSFFFPLSLSFGFVLLVVFCLFVFVVESFDDHDLLSRSQQL